jgi:hypothetical protein
MTPSVPQERGQGWYEHTRPLTSSALSAEFAGPGHRIAIGAGDRREALTPWHVPRVFQHRDRFGPELGHQLVHVIDLDIHLKPADVAGRSGARRVLRYLAHVWNLTDKADVAPPGTAAVQSPPDGEQAVEV